MTEKLTERDYEVLDACCELLSIKIDELKAENFELKESLKCFQTPEATKALTFYKTGEFELQEKKCIELEQENARLKEILQEIKEIAKRCNLCEECSGLEDCERECGDAVEPCSTYQMQIIVNKLTKAEGKWK